MSELLVFDSNVYIQALRDAERLRHFKRQLIRHGRRVRINAVVALELRVGARTRAQQHALQQLLDSYAERQRIIVPSYEAYLQAGRALAEAADKHRVSIAGGSPRLINDALLAASCREAGATLVTANVRDFAILKRFMKGFRYVTADTLH